MHWTYSTFSPGDALCQGDILVPADEFQEFIRQNRERFHLQSDKFLAYVVVTQSCDLVLRQAGRCSAPYISLAPVQSLYEVTRWLLDRECARVVDGVYESEGKPRIRQTLRRIINQNESGIGLFYLHPEPEAGISVSSAAILRLAVSVESSYYSVLQRSRRGRLASEFQAKLGWLVGNIYSRVGVRDWTEDKTDEEEMKKMVDVYVEGENDVEPPHYWISRSWVKAARNAGMSFDCEDVEDLIKRLEEHRPKEPLEQIVESVDEIAKQVFVGAGEQDFAKFAKFVRERAGIQGILKRAVAEAKLE